MSETIDPTEGAESTEETGPRLYEIPEQNMDRLLAELKTLNKRARRLKVAEIQLIDHGTIAKKHERDVGGERIEYTVVYHRLEVLGETPKLAGWSFEATIDFEDGLVMLRSVPGSDELPRDCREATPARCDHCGVKNSRRTAVFVVRHEECGEYQVVGRTCTRDFLGGKSPQGIASWLELVHSFLEDVGEAEESGFGGGGWIPQRANTPDFLGAVATHVREFGWMSRGEARESGRQATADWAWWICTGPGSSAPREVDRWREARALMGPRDHEKARRMLWWGGEHLWPLTNGQLSDFEFNLRQALSQDTVTWKRAGITAATIVPYARHTEEQIRRERAARNPSEYVGELKQRMDLGEVTVVFTRSFESDWGVTTLVKFEDGDGNVFAWFASRSHGLEVGHKITLRGTVKKHEEYEGQKQTMLTRCVVKEAS